MDRDGLDHTKAGNGPAAAGSTLGVQPVGKLLLQYAVPTIASTLVASLYNMIDQVFIGRRVGYLGNAATTVAYPLTILCGALCLLVSNGSNIPFNMSNGKGQRKEAMGFAGNCLTLLLIEGLVLAAAVATFTPRLIYIFGSTEEVAPYAMRYMRIIAAGIPFLTFTNGGTLLVRSDGSPKYAMVCSMSGVIINFVLDYLFLYPLDMGIGGAAWATVIGQVISAVMTLLYMFRFKTGRFQRDDFVLSGSRLRQIVSLGAAASLNQAAMLVMNMVLNSSLRHYGNLSVYGGSEALAAAGIVTKVSFLFFSTIIGCSIGGQPIMAFNFGAKNYDRVIKTYRLILAYALCVGALETVIFRVFPMQIIRLFGNGELGYSEFAVRYMQVFMLLVILTGIPPISMNVMSSIGKAKKGIVISMSKQLILIVLLLLIPLRFGIDGILYAGPVADVIAAAASYIVLRPEFKKMKEMQSCLYT